MRKTTFAIAAVFALLHRPALAADMPLKAPPPPPPVASWTGFYVGIDGGYAWNQNTGDAVCTTPTGVVFGLGCTNPTGPVMGASGGFFGGEAGYNFQKGIIVTGIETDLQWSDVKGSGTTLLTEQPIFVGPVATYTATSNLDWFGTTRARIGILPQPQLLLYVTGGAIYGYESATATGTALPGHLPAIFPATGATTAVGGTAGGGIEYAFNGNLSAKVEGLYYDMGTLTAAFTCPAAATTCTPGYSENGTFAMRGVILRAGLNWHFGSGS
jgi:outer membrane immunogenic protein